MAYSENIYLHAFNLVPGFGPTRLLRVAAHFASPAEAYSASAAQLAAAGIEPEMAENCRRTLSATNLEKAAEQLDRQGIRLLRPADRGYPDLLKEISKFPALLYYKGFMENPDELCLSVVGTRAMSTYGRTVIPLLIRPLSEAGLTLVSGLAYGVDTAVQKIVLEQGRRTVAVVGNGLDEKSFYPKEHSYIADGILAHGGAIISEYPPGTPPLKHHFIARNRIIAGMSAATMVIECDIKSGSLITAQYALEQNRTVYAVPGPIYAQTSQGPNNLIKMGARPVTDAKDILDDLNVVERPALREAQASIGETAAEQTVLDLLSFEPITMDELIKRSPLQTGEVTATLTFLEMKGKVRNVGGQQYVLSR